MAIVTPVLTDIVSAPSTFTWKDSLYSGTAASAGLLSDQYNITDTIQTSVLALYANVINPLFTAFPGQFRINSLYRAPATERLVSGRAYGQHMLGQAVDIKGINGTLTRDLFNYIVANLPYDQLIWEISVNGGTAPSPFSAPTTGGEPGWVHISFDNTKVTQRKQILFGDTVSKPAKYTPINLDPNVKPDNVEPRFDGTTKLTDSSKSTDLHGNQTNASLNPNLQGPSLKRTFDQINTNLANVEASDVDVTWGKRSSQAEDSDWIGLKQFLLYLASRMSPQSLLPFVELIPIISIDQPQDAQTVQQEIKQSGLDGDTPKDLQNNLTSTAADTKDQAKQKNILKDALKFVGEPPPGFNANRFATGANASNAASNTADLFTLDPFKEGIDYIGVLSDGGAAVVKERNVGVRVYGQLVLNPAAIPGEPSKPGAIGFKSLEINAGSQADNGMSMIKMTLVDVQGNKFTDINSPWAFIYDTRPGSIGGDFYFRYGWQIRVPDPNDKNDPLSAKFWYHPGWDVFDNGTTSGIRNTIMQQIVPGKQVITLTQAINTGRNVDAQDAKQQFPLALFDEGMSFQETDGTVRVSRYALNDNNYVRLSLLNPEIDMDDNGAITATLSFRTTGSIVFTLPLDYAITTRRLFTLPSPRNAVLLGDLILALQNDSDNFGYIGLRSREDRLRQSDNAKINTKQKAKDRNFDGFVLIQGPDKGGSFGDIHPDEIIINVDKKHMRQLLTSQRESGVTLIRWFREVLQNNKCELLSAATGSGAGINSAWIITTTLEKNERQTVVKQPTVGGDTTNSQTIEVFKTEKDIFSYRFAGSLVTSMKVEKTETPNAQKIATDFDLSGLQDYNPEAGDAEAQFTKPVTASDRSRNLKIIFAQMQNCSIECLAHPWLGPGKRIFVKGMGFFDGEYQVLEVTHKLEGHRFTSNIIGARILLTNPATDPIPDNKNLSSANGNRNFAQPVSKQLDTSSDPAIQAKPPASNQANSQNQGFAQTISSAVRQPIPPSVTAATAAVIPSPNSHSSSLLRKLSPSDANASLGALLSIEPLLEGTVGADTIAQAKACLCEMRKGNGIDVSWFQPSDPLKNLLDKLLSNAQADNPLPYSQLVTIGAAGNFKYTTIATINGSKTTIVVGS
jgi:hypothetical protein